MVKVLNIRRKAHPRYLRRYLSASCNNTYASALNIAIELVEDDLCAIWRKISQVVSCAGCRIEEELRACHFCGSVDSVNSCSSASGDRSSDARTAACPAKWA